MIFSSEHSTTLLLTKALTSPLIASYSSNTQYFSQVVWGPKLFPWEFIGTNEEKSMNEKERLHSAWNASLLLNYSHSYILPLHIILFQEQWPHSPQNLYYMAELFHWEGWCSRALPLCFWHSGTGCWWECRHLLPCLPGSWTASLLYIVGLPSLHKTALSGVINGKTRCLVDFCIFWTFWIL